MKQTLFLLLLFSALMLSCVREKESSPNEIAGRVNSVSLIIDDLLWNGEIGDSIRNKFASPVIGLPQEEPLFTINQYPAKLLEGYMANSRNIIVVKKGDHRQFAIRKNQFRTPQNVIYITGRTSREIINLIEDNAQTIVDQIRSSEISSLQQKFRENPLKTARIANKFRVNADIPIGYSYVLEGDGFLWLKKEITSGNTSILFYELPLSSIDSVQNIASDIIRLRDSIGGVYIHGTIPGTRMVTEGSYAPYFVKTKVCSRIAYETKGTWELNGDYMSGPFINYFIIDKPGNRILAIEGFCYAPSKEKRDLMFELEAIVKSVKFLKRKTSDGNTMEN